MSRFVEAQDRLSARRRDVAADPVAYVRGNREVVLPATIGRTVFDEIDEHGISYKSESRDFVLTASDLVIDGQPTLPSLGDQIRETGADGRTYVYEVMPLNGEPGYRFSANRLSLRVHTKRIAVL